MKALSVIIGLLLYYGVHAQRVHTVYMYLPFFEEFDTQESLFRITGSKGYLSCPIAVGFGYSRYLGKSFLQVNLHLYNYHTPKSSMEQVPGETREQHYWSVATDYVHVLKRMNTPKSLVGFIGSVKFRMGGDSYHYPYIDVVPARWNRDIGASAGLSWKCFPKNRVAISLDVLYTRWLFLYYHHLQYDPDPYPLPRNSLDLRFCIGYTFGKQVGD